MLISKKDVKILLKYSLRFLPDKLYIKLYYRIALKRKLNLESPVTFNEKIQWLKFNNRSPFFTMVSDKYKVRPYVGEKIGDKYLVKLLGVWDSFDEINFNQLPNRFVLKCNHDSGGLAICYDKNNFDIKNARRIIEASLKRNFFYVGREWQYKNIKPKIICEELLCDEQGNVPVDYKISCFNGKVDNIMVCIERFTKTGVKFYFFDKEWQLLRLNRGDEKLPLDFTLPKPDNLEEMINIAEQLSEPFTYARIDLYNLNGKVYFSEITLSPNSGFDSDITYETDLMFGKKLKIPYFD